MALFNFRKGTTIFFLGIRSTFYRLSMLTGNGLIVIVGGYLDNSMVTKAWSYTMIIVGC
jgi:PAT family beta-lactamase induction signal transducer AmpG